jgi:hypothetical protein
MKKKKPKPQPQPIDRSPPADDPRNIHHPIHDEKWRALARALGQMDARKDFEILYGRKAPDQFAEDRAGRGDKPRG